MTTNDENIHIGEFIKTVFGYWKIYVPIGIAFLIGAIVFLMITPKEYRVISRIQLLSEKQGMMSELKMIKSSGLGGLLGGSSSGVNVDDEITIMLSRQNLTNVIEDNELQVQTYLHDGFKKLILDREESPVSFIFPQGFLQDLQRPINISLTIKGNTIEKVKCKSSLFKTITFRNLALPATLSLPVGDIMLVRNNSMDGEFTINLLPLQLVYEVMDKDLNIKSSEKASDVVYMSYESSNKLRAKKILNSVMNQYNNYSRGVKVRDANLNAGFVRDRLDSITLELTMLEIQLEKYKQSNKMPDPELYAQATYYTNKDIEKTILETETRLHMLNYVIKYIEDPKNEYSAIPIVDGTGETAVGHYNQLLVERQYMLLTTESNNPALMLIDLQLKEQRKMLLETIKNVAKNNLQISLNALYNKDNTLIQQIDKLPTQEREFIEMKRKQKIKESIYLFLIQKLQEKELINSPDEVAGRIVDEAYTSYKHIFPKTSIVLIIAFILASMVSLFIISLRIFVFNKE